MNKRLWLAIMSQYTAAPDAFTKFLLHCNGINGSTTFIDEKGKAVTANGNAQISTAQSEFGGASGLFDGTGDYLSTPNSADFDFGTGDFTAEWWEYRTSAAAGKSVISRANTSGYAPWHFGYSSGTNNTVYITSNGSSWDIANGVSMGSISLNTWTHFAITRSGTTFKTFKNGTTVSTFTSSAAIQTVTQPLVVGINEGASANSFQGYIDELRISKGIARWTADFTPPTSEYTI